MTARELYEQTIKSMPPWERFQLATLILNDISPRAISDYSEEWTEEDMREATLYSLQRAAASLGEDEDDA